MDRRVAFFTDSFHEINGVALTSRQFEDFARRRGLPFLNVHAGPRTERTESGSIVTLELERGPAAFPVERDMSFDPLFLRHRKLAAGVLRDFRPDLIHITGPSDVGILGANLAHSLRIPLVASWHTNLHEFGARRLDKVLSFLPDSTRGSLTGFTERRILDGCARFYRLARILFAPNRELVDLLYAATGKPVFLMQRGSNPALFDPRKRDRSNDAFTLGFVGRVTAEKSVRFLAGIEQALIAAGHSNYRFLIVGDGGEREWLQANLQRAEFPGVLTGDALARAYANMDLFVFPSRTDTFGNVVIEALASGVPAIVTNQGGPKFLVRTGIDGFVADSDAAFIRHVLHVIGDPSLRDRMGAAAREHALSMSWDRVFERVYEAYESLDGNTLRAAG